MVYTTHLRAYGVPHGREASLAFLSPLVQYILLRCLVTQVRALERRRDFDEALATEHAKQKRPASSFGLSLVGSDAVRSKILRSSRRNSLRVCLDAFLPFF